MWLNAQNTLYSLLVITGVLLIPIANLTGLDFLSHFFDLRYVIFCILPVLIFESAYNIKLSTLKENTLVITTSRWFLFIIDIFIGGVGTIAMQMIGFDVPFMLMLIWNYYICDRSSRRFGFV